MVEWQKGSIEQQKQLRNCQFELFSEFCKCFETENKTRINLCLGFTKKSEGNRHQNKHFSIAEPLGYKTLENHLKQESQRLQ